MAETGRTTISSRELGDGLDLTDAQVRKDLAYFGQFGHPGVGYRVPDMVRKLRQVLGTDRNWDMAIVGAGNLGRALASHAGFTMKGFHLVAVFDSDETKVGQPFGDKVVQPIAQMAEHLQRHGIRLAILAVPPEPAQTIADALVAAGVTGILNFAPVRLVVPPNVTVNSVDLAAQLEQIVFRLHDDPLP